ncbi:MAG: ABC transporter permease [Cyclobacteriaceae bacterium]
MLKSYIKVALRNLWKRKVYSLINIIGLAIGIGACLLIVLYVQDEFSYDKHYSESDRIYRVIRQATNGGEVQQAAAVNYALQDLLIDNFPQIEKAGRLAPRGKSLLTNPENELEFVEERFFFAEQSMVEIFDLEFLSGDPAAALGEPFNILLTEAMAQKYFKDQNPIGKTLQLDGDKTFKVSGVIKEAPINSHFHYDFLASFNSTKGWYRPVMFEHWGNIWMYSYLLLKDGADFQDLERQFVQMLDTHGPPALKQFGVSFILQPLEDIHLYSQAQGEIEQNGNATFVYVFMAVAILILLIACFNFINLATARSQWRAKEVGIRKVVGARKKHLIYQFLGESLFLTAIGTILATISVALILPYFNEFTGKALSLSLTSNGIVWFSLISIVLLVGLMSGSFPAFMLSSFKPIQVLKGKAVGDQKSASRLRMGLVIFQFTISIVLIIGTIIVYQQLQFMKNKDLGIETEQVLVVPLNSNSARENAEILKTNFSSNANVSMASMASDVPPSRLNSWRFHQIGTPAETEELIDIVAVDYDYLDILDINVIEGSKLSQDFATHETEGVIFNQAAVDHLGLNNSLGTRFESSTDGKTFNVIGVVENFHFSSLHEEIKPLALHIWPSWYRNVLVKVKVADVSETVAYLENVWNQTVTDWAFEYYFLDQEFGKLYQTEEKLGSLVTYFSVLAIFIASLGLFGLASFMAEQKIKEIGIRKVLGASIPGIVWLQFRVFLSLVAVALILAIPLGIYSMDLWLQDFAYRIDMSWMVFAAAGAFALVTAFLTVSYQSIKAALANPVDSLRWE